MLEYLDKLVDEHKWEEALAYAEQLLHQVEDDPRTLLRLNVAMLVCRQELGEYLGAQTIGQLCLKMLTELDAWEYFGTVSLFLGTANDRMGQYDAALEVWQEYLKSDRSRRSDPFYEIVIGYNMGIVHAKTGHPEQAIAAFNGALQIAYSAGEHRLAHGIRHAMIEAHTKQGNIREVPRLLAKSLHYIRHLGDSRSEFETSRLWHFVIRAEFALCSNRLTRARLIAEKGLGEAEGDHRLSSAFYMVLAQIARAQGNLELAIEHALSARIEAIACRRYDLEYESADLMYQLLQAK